MCRTERRLQFLITTERLQYRCRHNMITRYLLFAGVSANAMQFFFLGVNINKRGGKDNLKAQFLLAFNSSKHCYHKCIFFSLPSSFSHCLSHTHPSAPELTLPQLLWKGHLSAQRLINPSIPGSRPTLGVSLFPTCCHPRLQTSRHLPIVSAAEGGGTRGRKPCDDMHMR